MLYYLFQYLESSFDFPGARLFSYISFRSGVAFILALFIATIIGRRIINKLQILQIGELVRDLGLEGQMSKKGTPTMGGIIIIIAILIPCLLVGRLGNIYMILMLITTVWLGAIGFLDDYIKVFKKDKEGLHGRFKIVGQVGLGLIVGLTLFLSPDVVIRENGANLTDGLDGLATGTSAIMGLTLGILAYLSGHIAYASYLNIMYIPGSEELVVFASAFMGATIGFLWYNAFPAQVFMGDTGSLTLGGIIAVFALCIHKELLIPILCAIFFVEDLSVMIQVAYFKITKRKYGEGRRVFKMTPLHHHFQKPGNAGINALIQKPLQAVPESKIVVRFWIVCIMLAAITIVTLKMR